MASGIASSVAGGRQNTASGEHSVVLGGQENVSGGPIPFPDDFVGARLLCDWWHLISLKLKLALYFMDGSV